MIISRRLRYLFVLCILAIAAPPHVYALDPVPRQWSHLPLDTNFFGMAYAYTEADIGLDPVLRTEDVEMELDTWGVKYIRSFEAFGKSARVDLTQAYQEAEWTGLLDGAPAAVSRHGPSDTFVRIAINLYVAPPLGGKEYAQYRQNAGSETIVGAALAVRLPTGDYKKDKLLNLGQNRFVLRPQLGLMHTWGQWSIDMTGEVAFYGDNDEFFNGNKREQDPMLLVYGSLIHTFRPGHWLGASFGFDSGGEGTINGVEKNDHRKDLGAALSYAYPVTRTSSIVTRYLRTETQEDIGNDSDTLSVNFSLAW